MEHENELVTYMADTPVGLIYDGTTLWATVKHISDVFGTSGDNVRTHIKNIYAEGELMASRTSKEIAGVVENRPNFKITVYNLDVVINVGYRVSSAKATKFRQWATKLISDRVLGQAKGALPADEQRVMIADRVAVENNELVTAGRELGVVDDAAFLNAGYQGMYKMKMPAIKKVKGLTDERLLDRAGITELAANEFRITQTNDKLRKLKEEDGNLVGHGVALTVHHDVGRTVRSAIEEIGGTMPEDHPLEPEHISEVRKRVLSAKVKPKLPNTDE